MGETAHFRDYLKLHFLIVCWGFTAILGELIRLPAMEVVLYRSGIAAVVLALWISWNNAGVPLSSIPKRRTWAMIGTGGLIGAHWTLFFLAVKVANVSVCMIGIATISLWTALMEPLMVKDHGWRRVDLVFGVLIIFAVAFIFQAEMQYALGFVIAIASAIFAAIFSVINGRFAKSTPHRHIAFWEMVGACLTCIICLPLSASVMTDGAGLDMIPSLTDAAYLFVLATVCTVYAYTQYVELLRRLSVFTVNFANNLEPVYGMFLGAVLLGDHKTLGPSFYLGATLIASCVLAHSFWSRIDGVTRRFAARRKILKNV